MARIVRKKTHATGQDVGKKVENLLELKAARVTVVPVKGAVPTQYEVLWEMPVSDDEIREDG